MHAIAMVLLTIGIFMSGWWVLVFAAMMAFHLLVGLWRVYAQSWFWTIMKFATIGGLYALTFTVTLFVAWMVVIATL